MGLYSLRVSHNELVQKVKLKKNVKTVISGTVEFMACTDEECLPPQTVTFSMPLE